MLKRIALTCLMTASCSAVFASFPVVQRSEPLGVVRGEQTTLVFHGDRLGDAHTALCDLPGIEIIGVKAIDKSKASVEIRTAESLSPGLYPIRIVTHSGVSNVRLVGVGTMPITKENEPNNDFSAPQPIGFNTTVEGVVDREDLDHYQVELKAGQRINVEIEGVRLSYTLRNQNILDPYIAILNEGRFEVSSSDDSSLLAQDGLCTFVAPEDGKYTVLVRDSSFGGNRVCGYRLHIGDFPRPIAVIPGGGKTGETLKANLVSLAGDITEASVTLPSNPIERYGVVTETDSGISPSPNWIRVSELPLVTEAEPNNDYRKPPVITAPVAFCGVIEEPNDYDCFGFECKKGQRFRVNCFAREPLRSPLDAVMNVFGPDNKTISSSDDVGTSKDPSFEFTAKADGIHTIRIYDQLRGGSGIHQYRIDVDVADPTFKVTLKELRRDESAVASVPAGGHGAVMALASRKGYGGEIAMKLDGLPDGVQATTFPIPSGRGEIPVLFTAAKDAAHTAALFQVQGAGTLKDDKVTGTFGQTHKLVLGQNRRSMWNYDTSHAAIAVTDSAPFKIELVQPKTPIVRNGSKNMKVRIIRDEGFDDSVRIRTLYNPPGVGVNNSRRIDKGKSEVDIPITANNGAAIGEWPLIFIASYAAKHGTAEIATPAIKLDVQSDIFGYEFPRVAAELGTESIVSVKLDIKREYSGDAEIELVGLPKGVTSPAGKQKITPESTDVQFPIVIAKDAKVGKHKTLVCIARIVVGDETIVQTRGTGELRIDKPLPVKKATPIAKKPEPKTTKKPAAPKPLSRLEQLRQMKGQ